MIQESTWFRRAHMGTFLGINHIATSTNGLEDGEKVDTMTETGMPGPNKQQNQRMVLYVLQPFFQLFIFVVAICKIDKLKRHIFSNFFTYIEHSSIVV